MPLPTLPPEIIATILEQAKTITERGEEPRRDIKTMAAACLVSRTFLPPARRLLYATIELKVDFLPSAATEEEDIFSRAQHAADPESYKPSQATSTLVKAATSPHLSALARTLVVDLSGSTGDKLAKSVANILRDCTGVTQVIISNLHDLGISTNELLHAFTLHGERVRRLGMVECGSFGHTTDAPPLYSAFHSLDDLLLDYCRILPAEEEPLAAVLPSRLRRFHHKGGILDIPLPALLRHSSDTLQYLELNPPAAGDTYDLSRFTKLEALRYRVAHPSLGLGQADLLLEMLDSTRKLEVLHTIELTVRAPLDDETSSAHQDWITFLNHLTSGRILRRFPPSTTALHLACYNLPLGTIVAWVDDLPLKPALRRLSPPTSYWSRLTGPKLRSSSSAPL